MKTIRITTKRRIEHKLNYFIFVLGPIVIVALMIVIFVNGALQKNIASKQEDYLFVPTHTIKEKKDLREVIVNEAQRYVTRTLSTTPISPFPKFDSNLPCSSNCVSDAAPGWGPSQQFLTGKWIQEIDLTNKVSGRKWSFITYTFPGSFHSLTNNNLIIPSGNFFTQVTSTSINSSKSFIYKPFGKNIEITYTRLPDQLIENTINAFVFDVKPMFDPDSITRREAVFVKDNHTIVIMFDWKTKEFEGTFENILKSIRFKK